MLGNLNMFRYTLLYLYKVIVGPLYDFFAEKNVDTLPP